jgi:hypothetical protein
MKQALFPHEERTTFGVMAMRVFITHSGLAVGLFLTAYCLSYPKIDQIAEGCLVVLYFPFAIVPVLGDRLAGQAFLLLPFILGVWLFTIVFWTSVVTGIVWLCRRLRERHVLNETHVIDASTEIRRGSRDIPRGLFPYSHPWTSVQKSIIASAVSLGVIVSAAFVVGYELHLRRVVEASLIEHTWSKDCTDCATADITFHADHTIDVKQERIGPTFRGKGTWQLSGRDFVVVDYRARAEASTPLPEEHTHQTLRMLSSTTAETVSLYPIFYARED